jgi:hypothetical protein
MRATRQTVTKGALGAALLVIGVLLAFSLPPGFLAGQGSAQVATTTAMGFLDVNTNMNSGGSQTTPLAGVSVGIFQNVLHGIRLGFLKTNQTGSTEFPLLAGQYIVSLQDPRFTVQTTVNIYPYTTTQLNVQVNRTSYVADFVDAQDETSAGQIQPWNTLVVAISAETVGPFPYMSLTNASIPNLGSKVFVQPMRFYYGGTLYSYNGTEVPSEVVSQTVNLGQTWLTLQPLLELNLGGSVFIMVVDYAAGSAVNYIHG